MNCGTEASRRMRPGCALLAVAVATLSLTACSAQPDKAAVNAAERQLRTALDAGDGPGIKAAVDHLRTALGKHVGQPEGGEPKRAQAAGLAPATVDTARTYLEKYRSRHAARIEQAIATVAEPTKQEAGLRQLATLVIANAQLIAAGEQPRETLRHELLRAADALLRVQRPNGLFPFPDIRAKSEFFGRLIRDLLAKHPDALADGWLVSDGGRGDLQYDHGLCGVALLEAFALTSDQKYLAAAQRAAGWVKTQPIVTNWNYNSFSVWFLARLALVTGQREWLDEAVHRCQLGLLPGQLANGRWIDPHNAKLVYHAILCRALVEVAIAGRKLGVPVDAIEQAARAGLDNAAQEILTQGVSVVTVPTEVFSRALLHWRDEPRWRDTLNALAAVAFTPRATDSEIGFYAAAYLQYAKSR
jgi:hypothetical protein